MPVKALGKPTRNARLIVQPLLEGVPDGWAPEASLVSPVDVQ